MKDEITNKIYTYDEAKEKIAQIYSVILDAPTQEDYYLKTKKEENIIWNIFRGMVAIFSISALISLFVGPVSEYSIRFYCGASIGILICFFLLKFVIKFILKKKYPDWYKSYELSGFKTQEQLCNEINNIILNTDVVIFEKLKYNTTAVFINIGYLENPKFCNASISIYEDIVDGTAVYKTKILNFI